jgi:glycolate dehydrogenase FAD-binding subunit
MAVSTRAVAEALGGVLGAGRLVDGAVAETVADGVAPRWVARPATADDVARVVRIAADERLIVAPRGSGSALELGRPLERVDLLLDLADLDRVLEDNPDDLTITVEAGVRCGDLDARLAARGQWLPIDAPGGATRTVGGIVATNAVGPLRARYGTIRDVLLGVRFVQASGVSTWGGARVVKSVSGYDVPRLMVGALGTLGVLTEFTLRLHPRPEAERTTLVGFADAPAAIELVRHVLDSALQPNRVELVDGRALAACGGPAAAVAIAICFGSVEEAVREQTDALERLAATAGGHARPVDAAFWARLGAAMAGAPGDTVVRAALLVEQLPAALEAIERTAAAETIAPLVSGCAALGTLRVRCPATPATSGARLVEALRAVAASSDGTVIVEAGPRALRAAVDPWGAIAPEVLALMRAVRAEFDPARILNPGRHAGDVG